MAKDSGNGSNRETGGRAEAQSTHQPSNAARTLGAPISNRPHGRSPIISARQLPRRPARPSQSLAAASPERISRRAFPKQVLNGVASVARVPAGDRLRNVGATLPEHDDEAPRRRRLQRPSGNPPKTGSLAPVASDRAVIGRSPSHVAGATTGLARNGESLQCRIA